MRAYCFAIREDLYSFQYSFDLGSTPDTNYWGHITLNIRKSADKKYEVDKVYEFEIKDIDRSSIVGETEKS